jgi:tripartite-type tricarboxylate transporter receptor subunit TctC
MTYRLRPFTANISLAAVILFAVFPYSRAIAGEFSGQPIKYVVAFAPAGPADLLSRRIALHLSKLLETPVIVDNKPGAGGEIATMSVVNAKGISILTRSTTWRSGTQN